MQVNVAYLFLGTFIITLDRLLKLFCPFFCLHVYANSRSAALTFIKCDNGGLNINYWTT